MTVTFDKKNRRLGGFVFLLSRKKVFQKVYGFREIELFDNHRQFNGVEVLRTAETASEIGFRINGCIVIHASRTNEAVEIFRMLARMAQDVAQQVR